MKSVIALIVGLMVAGAATAYSDFSLTAPTAIQSYFFSISEPSVFLILLAGMALMLFVSFREHQEFIDRKGLEAEGSTESPPFRSHQNPTNREVSYRLSSRN
jgi:hypothetical protein